MSRRVLSGILGSLISWTVPIVAEEPTDPSVKFVDEVPGYVGEPINLSLRDADLAETLRTFAEIGKFNLILQPEISGTVTVELKNVPWDQALDQILKIHGLGMEVTGPGFPGGGLYVSTREVIAQRRRNLMKPTVVRLELKHADATVVARFMSRAESGILTRDGAVRAEPGNKLAIRDTGVRLLHVGRLLARVDVPAAADDPPADLEKRCLNAWRELTTS